MPILPEVNEIKVLRRKLNINQKQLEEDLEIPQSTISRIENRIGNPSYMTVKKIFDYLERKKSDTRIDREAGNIMSKKIISINSNSTIKNAVELMNKHKISQLPVINGNQNLGSITAKRIQKTIIDNPELINAKIDLVKDLPFPEIEKSWDIRDISNLLTNYSAILVKEYGEYIGIITDADFLKFT